MAQKKITDLQLRTDVDTSCNFPVDDATQTWRVTGEQLADFILPDGGVTKEKVYSDVAGAGLAQNVDGSLEVKVDDATLEIDSDTVRVKDGGISSAKAGFTLPTVQKFLTGSGTYTTPSGVKSIRVRMVGGGGGGGGSGTASGGTGGTGGNTTFGTSLLAANGGAGGAGSAGSGSLGGAGGSASLGTGPIGIALPGAAGTVGGVFYVSYAAGGHGGVSVFGGAGSGGCNAGGASAASNSGSGGGGGGAGNTGGSSLIGFGGGAGGFIDALIHNPDASYAYAVGAGGTAGSAGTSGAVGGVGGSGLIIVEEFYQ